MKRDDADERLVRILDRLAGRVALRDHPRDFEDA
jgi:hypothetical protein